MKKFAFAGVSRIKGALKVRFSDRDTYVKALAVAGNSDIDIIQLREPLTKEEAIAFLISIDFDNGNAEVRDCLYAEVEKRAPRVARVKTEKAVKVAKAVKAKPTLASIAAKAPAKKSVPASTVTRAEIEAQLADLDNAPF